MRQVQILAISLFFTAAAALADQPLSTIATLPSHGIVTVDGTVEKVSNDRKFVLRDKTGAVNVKFTNTASAVLKEGDSVSVTGAIKTGFFGGRSIEASKVDVHKDLGTALSDTVTQTTGLSLDQAKTVQIARLPSEGMVKLTGTVDDVKNDKSFTLKDATGSVSINVQSDEKAALAKGAEVSVIGYVDSGLLGKTVRATHVMVTADATAKSGVSDTR